MNGCGDCKACCVVLPIAEPDFVKPAGVPCKHLCESGCGIYGSEAWPKLCREYLCGWRREKWLNQRPLYRPDKLGVIFQFSQGRLALFECIAGALQSPQVQYVKNRLRGTRIVKNYPVGVLNDLHLTPEVVHNGGSDLDRDIHQWEELGGNERTLRQKASRIPLPLVAQERDKMNKWKLLVNGAVGVADVLMMMKANRSLVASGCVMYCLIAAKQAEIGEAEAFAWLRAVVAVAAASDPLNEEKFYQLIAMYQEQGGFACLAPVAAK